MHSHPLYLDYAATTPVDPAVLQAMLPYFQEHFGNASSRNHRFGWLAAEAIDAAREQVGSLIGAETAEVVFTSGATESLNLAIKGVAARYREKGRHIITCATEHRAVLDACRHLEQQGLELTVLGVNSQGALDLDQLSAAIRPDTILVVCMWGNNETGVLHPVEEIANRVHAGQSLFCCDATQAVGKVPVNVQQQRVDLLALSAHKIYGPKGCGALYVRRRQPRVQLEALMDGGGHERGLRSGTLNVPGIVGLGKAAELALQRLAQDSTHVTALRERLEQQISSRTGAVINGLGSERLPHISNLRFSGRKAESLLAAASDHLAASTASACSSASLEPSHVLTAMGLSPVDAEASLRLSLGRSLTQQSMDAAVEDFLGVWERMGE